VVLAVGPQAQLLEPLRALGMGGVTELTQPKESHPRSDWRPVPRFPMATDCLVRFI